METGAIVEAGARVKAQAVKDRLVKKRLKDRLGVEQETTKRRGTRVWSICESWGVHGWGEEQSGSAGLAHGIQALIPMRSI